MKKLLLTAASFCLLAGTAFSHCQVPCGVYTDEMRFSMIEEDLQTIEKAMAQITKLSQGSEADIATVARWTMVKEEHADKIQDIVSVYFMTQRIKPDAKDYVEKLTTLHGLLISAMKCKQTVDPAHVETTRTLLKKFHGLYFEGVKHDH